MKAAGREKGQQRASETEATLYPRIESEHSSIAQGNTPDINSSYDFAQQVDIQRKDQKPHIDIAPSTEQDDARQGDKPAPVPPQVDVPPPGQPGHPERYIPRTPYHR